MIKIISDSTCDLSKELIERYNIAILPLHIHLGEDEYEDGVTITPDEIYQWSDDNNTTPKTSASSMGEAVEFFQPYIENGDEIIFFSISSSMSANYKVMCLAAEDLEAKAEAVIDIEAKEEISYEDFAKLQFQVGEIIACEAVKKSKKLLCSQVKIGSQVKQIVSGIKAHYTPEELVVKKVMVLVNLKPATLAGVLSEGMLLCAEDAEGNLALMKPEKEMPSGAEIC